MGSRELESLGWQRFSIRFGSLLAVFAVMLACGGTDNSQNATQSDLCDCQPSEPASADFRHAAKHVPLPTGTATPVTVETILSWEQDDNIADDKPRDGRENTLFQVDQAFLRGASVQKGDCDLHLEIPATADKNAPRVIVETPVDAEYCPARRNIQSQLKQHGFDLSESSGGEIQQPIPVTVTGLAFQDRGHARGSAQVNTTWELHPAVVTAR